VHRDLTYEIDLAARVGHLRHVSPGERAHAVLKLAQILGDEPSLSQQAVFRMVRLIHRHHAAEAFPALCGQRHGLLGHQCAKAAQEHIISASDGLDVVELRGDPERRIVVQFGAGERMVAPDLAEDLVKGLHVGIGSRLGRRPRQGVGQSRRRLGHRILHLS